MRETTWVAPVTLCAGAFWFSSVIRRRFLDLIPMARETIIEQLEDGNAAARQLLGGGEAALVGRTLPDLAAPPALIAAMARRERFHMELHLPEPPERYIEVRSTPLSSGRAAVTGRLVQLRDITARKRRRMSGCRRNCARTRSATR